MGFRESEILQVVYNINCDITELVKEMDDTFDLLKWRREGFLNNKD
jgi:hypothetical protein